jgi:glutathione S-transferase
MRAEDEEGPMKLYHVPQSRSGRPRWLLEELGVPYDLVTLGMTDGSLKTPEHLKVHPHGAVPALQDGDLTIFESAAICLYLADKYPEKKLAPAVGTPARGLYYQWVVYTMATMEPPILQVFMHSLRLPEAERQPQVAQEGRDKFEHVAAVVSKALEGRSYLLADQFSAADVMVGSTLGWSSFMGLLEGFPVLQAYTQQLMQRPAFQRAQS